MADATNPDIKFLLDPYGDWAKGEGVPITEGLGMDLFEVQTKPWARFGIDCAIVHLHGRGDFTSLFVLDLPPGSKAIPQQHMYETVIYVIDGHGSTQVETADGRKHTFEWGPKSLFALPLNSKYQHFNGSGKERARLAAVNNLPIVMNLFHNVDFVFNSDYVFTDRFDPESGDYFSGEGDIEGRQPGDARAGTDHHRLSRGRACPAPDPGG